MVNELKREYQMSDSELCMFTSNLVQTMTRDLTEFTNRGVDAADISALEALGNAFEILPPDTYYKADVSIAVAAKNATRAGLEVKARDIIQCAIIKWGEGAPQYRKFGASSMTAMSDMKFLTMCRQVVTTAMGYISDLTSVGLTQSMIDDLNTEAQNYENNMNSINNAIETRDIKTSERVTDGNKIYSLVTKYCQIGKIIWDDVDETKYKDYVIYKVAQSSLSKPQNVAAAYDPLDPGIITLTWDLVAEATSYDIYVNIAATGAPSGSFYLLNTFAASPAIIPATYEKRNYFKIKAKNDLDVSPYSDEAWVDVPAGS